MSERLNGEKRMEMLIERLITMVGKSNERIEYLHNRVLHLEQMLLEDSAHTRENKTYTNYAPTAN